ncbi:iron chaperone [Arthrobacter sp. CAL618]|uniref:iron chaperone n=1 Tax=Arthrobacter sp. CAL618 TaxID=1055770 RepID=UPI00042A5C49|nr:DUF1801 domain-containing protein [Arthrobacter sp. CAL618]
MDSLDEAVAALGQPERECLERLIAVARAAAPDAVAGVSYGIPVLKVGGKPLIGVTASARHLAVHPFSPAVVDQVRGRLGDYSLSTGTIRFTPEHPLPATVVVEIVRARRAEITGSA